MNYKVWSWSKPSEGYAEKTPRTQSQPPQTQPQIRNEPQIGNEPPLHQPRNNKRDETSERLSERQHIPQISRNPFLEILNQCEGEGQHNTYIDDLSNQDEYLRPRNSNMR